MVSANPLPSFEHLRKLFDYNTLAGTLMWKRRTPDMFDGDARENNCLIWNEDNAGKLAGSHRTGGYATVTIDGESYRAHRIIWKLFNKSDPEIIDHINGDVTDNRIENLRSVSTAENSRNSRIPHDHPTGAYGVTQKGDKWEAKITINLGSFDTFEEACDARKRAEQTLGYHENHGRTDVPTMFPPGQIGGNRLPFKRKHPYARNRRHQKMNQAVISF